MNTILEATRENYDQEVFQSQVPVLVEFYTPGCPQCETIRPLLEQLSQRFQGRVKFVQVNIDAEPLLAARHLIEAVPTLMLFKGGTDIDDDVDFISPGALESELERTIRRNGQQTCACAH